MTWAKDSANGSVLLAAAVGPGQRNGDASSRGVEPSEILGLSCIDPS